jgi:hypothetical protein
MIRFIISLVLFYFIYKVAKFVIRLISENNKNKREENISGNRNSQSKINKDDIIDADFEELDSQKSDQKK